MSEASSPIRLDDVLAIDKLANRPPRIPNLQAETQALHTLARQLAEQSQTMLQTLVTMARDLCQAGTAGVSLLEVSLQGAEVFRCSAISGALEQYQQDVFAKQDSPCGTCLDYQAPQLYCHPERYFTHFQRVNPKIVEGLVIPLIAAGQPLGTIWVLSHDERRLFDAEDMRIMISLANFTAVALQSIHLRQTTEAALQREQAARHEAEAVRQALNESTRQVVAREQFLSQASAVLAGSMDYKTTLFNIAQLAVPFLADFCFFDIINANHQLERMAWYPSSPAECQGFDQIQLQRYVPSKTCENHPIVRVLISGQTNFMPDVNAAWIASATTNADHLQFLEEYQVRSLMTVPLIAHGRKLGALTVCLTAVANRCYTITDLRLAEELGRRAALALDNARLYQQAQYANRMKDEFLAILSHELRSPLNPILGWVQMIQKGHLDAARTAKAWTIIERNARLQAQLVEDLLDVSQILRGKLRLSVGLVDLVMIIRAAIETVQLAAQAKSIHIDALLDQTVAPVAGDATRLQQVVWNLLSNAVKFTPEGGRIGIKLEQVGSRILEPSKVGAGAEMGASAIAAHRLVQSYAQITVCDTGVGIHPNFLPRVFDYFRQADSATTRQFGGLGLGLTIVRQLVEAHGGTVWAESTGEGQGATFAVRLPLMPGQLMSRDTLQPSQPRFDLQGTQVLVIDSESEALEFATFVLEQAGATIIPASSTHAALTLLAESKPDVLLSDIGMPDNDSFRLMQQVRSLPPEQGGEVPAIALTPAPDNWDDHPTWATGFQRHLTKPIEPALLVKAIADLCGKLAWPT